MRSSVRSLVPLTGAPPQERASRSWRAAADLVWARWDVLQEAPSERRSAAFAAYLAALDAEASAAVALAAATTLDRAA